MGVRELLMPNVMLPKVHQNDCSYVSSADVPSDSLRENLAWWAVTRRTLINHKLSKLGGAWAFAWVWALAQDNTVILFTGTYTICVVENDAPAKPTYLRLTVVDMKVHITTFI